MTFHEANLSLQLLAEERVGFVMRSHAEMIGAQQDAAWHAAISAAADGTR